MGSLDESFLGIRKKAEVAERQRILRLIHDRVSPKLLAAVFAAQMALENLDEKDSAAGAQMTQASATMIEAIERLVEIFDPEITS